MREASLVVDNLPKVQSQYPTKRHYSTHFLDEDLRMAIRLYGIFSYFSSKKLSISELDDYDTNILFLETGNINLHNEVCLENERAMIDHEGNIIEKEDKKCYFVDALVVLEKIECESFVG